MGGLADLFREFGQATAMVIVIVAMAWFLLKKTFDTHEKAISMTHEAHEKERILWEKLMEKHFSTQEEAHRFQREEHEKVANLLNDVHTSLIVLVSRHREGD